MPVLAIVRGPRILIERRAHIAGTVALSGSGTAQSLRPSRFLALRTLRQPVRPEGVCVEPICQVGSIVAVVAADHGPHMRCQVVLRRVAQHPVGGLERALPGQLLRLRVRLVAQPLPVGLVAERFDD